MQTILIKHVPVNTPGEGMVEMLRRTPQVAKYTVLYSDTTPINAFELPGNIAVLNAWLHVTTDFQAGDASVSASANFSVPVATGAQIILVAATGTLISTAGAWATGPLAVIPASGGFGIINYTANTTTTGQFEVYMQYVDLDNRL